LRPYRRAGPYAPALTHHLGLELTHTAGKAFQGVALTCADAPMRRQRL